MKTSGRQKFAEKPGLAGRPSSRLPQCRHSSLRCRAWRATPWGGRLCPGLVTEYSSCSFTRTVRHGKTLVGWPAPFYHRAQRARGKREDSAMHLTPQERDKLLIHVAAEL